MSGVDSDTGVGSDSGVDSDSGVHIGSTGQCGQCKRTKRGSLHPLSYHRDWLLRMLHSYNQY